MATIEEEIGRIVRHRLAAEETVLLPGIGSLGIRRMPARRLSATRIAPPCRSVEFSSAEQGVSLVDTIARAASCTPEQAQDAYRRWLDKSRDSQSGRLTIVGVGTLFQKSFRPDPAFDRLLNPQGREVRTLRRTTPWWLWSLSTLGIVFLAAAGIFWLDPVTRWPEWFSSTPATVEMPLLTPAEKTDTTTVTTPQPTAPAVDSTATAPTPAETVPAATAEERPAAEEIVRTRSGESYVVLGIFSSERNARRAIEQAVAQTESLTEADCRIFLYGDKYLVSLGEAESREEAQAEAARRRKSGLPEVWVYSKR